MHKLAAVILGTLFIFACASPGYRWEHGCPPGEDCSDQTPDGLFFAGPELADDWVAGIELKGLAVGGTQNIRVQQGPSRSSYGFQGPFAAYSEEPELDVVSVIEPMVEVAGVADGDPWLRIADPVNGEIFDLIAVHARTIGDLRLLPIELGARDAALDGEPWAVLRGQPTRLYTRLVASGGGRLVDQSMLLDADTDLTPVQLAWDALEVTPQVAGTFAVDVEAGDLPLTTVNVDVVDDVTGIALVSAWDLTDDVEINLSQPLAVDHALLVCFAAHAGSARVVDPAWTVQAAGPIDGEFFTEPNFLLPTGCFYGAGTAEGTATITLGAGSLSIDVDLDFYYAAPARVAHAPVDPLQQEAPHGASGGTRAAR